MLKESRGTATKSYRISKKVVPFYNGNRSLQLSLDEKLLFTLYSENISIVDWEDCTVITQLHSSGTNDSSVDLITTNFCINPKRCTYNKDENDEIELVSTNEKFLLQVWRLSSLKFKDKEVVRSIKGHTMPILSMEYDSTGTLLATGCADRVVRVWDVAKGYCTHFFKEHTDIVQSVTFFSGSGKNDIFVLSSSDDTTVNVYNLNESKLQISLTHHLSASTGIAFSEDKALMVSVGRDKVLNFHEASSGNKCTFKHFKTMAVMDELESVAVFTRNQAVALCKNLVDSSGGSSSSSSSSAKKSSGNFYLVVCGGKKGVLYFYKVDVVAKATYEVGLLMSTSISSRTMGSGAAGAADHFSINKIHMSSNQLLVFTSDYIIHSYEISSISSERLVPKRQVIGCNDEILDSAFISSDSSGRGRLAVVTNSSIVKIVDVESVALQSTLQAHSDIVLSIAVTPDGRFAITASKDRTCRVWSISDVSLGADHNSCLCVCEGHVDAVNAVAICQLQNTLNSKLAFAFSGGVDKIVKKWSLSVPLSAKSNEVTINSVISVRAHEKDVTSMAVSPNDTLLATGSMDKAIRLWKCSDLSPVHKLSGHKRGIWRLVFSPVDKCLASASGDRTIKLWSISDYSCMRTFEGHSASVLSVAFINAGTQLVSGSADGLLRLWTIASGECENTYDEHLDKIWTVCVAGDSAISTFLTGGSDSNILRWEDCTAQDEETRLQKEEEMFLLEQQLQNDIRNRQYSKALSAALSLGHSNKSLTILTAILEDDDEEFSSDPKNDLYTRNLEANTVKLDEVVMALTQDQVKKLVGYLCDWNTNARHAFVSQTVLASFIRNVKAEALLQLRPFVESVDSFHAYSERHLARVDKLHQATYVLQYMTSLMTLLPIEEERRAEPVSGRKRAVSVDVKTADKPMKKKKIDKGYAH